MTADQKTKTLNDYLKKILTARVYDVAVESACDRAAFLSQRLNNHIWLKREDQQPVYSFKNRGAYNKVAQLSEEELKGGVIAASAGNHAQGLALAAEKLGIKATIVMPCTTPEIKVKSVKARGAKVVLHGDAFDDAYTHSQKLVEEKGLTYIHPYDDPYTIAGQGTIGMEILRQLQTQPDAVFVPVGGGGLAAGVAAYVKAIAPEIKVIGVESTESACLAAALAAGDRVILPEVGIFADGVAVAQIGEHTWEVCKDHIDEVITVTSDELCAAVKDAFDDTRAVCEPAGALAVAGVKRYVEREQCQDQHLVAILSGANVNFDRLRYISEVAEIGEGREIILAVTIPEQAGSFQRFCSLLNKRPITEFNYRYGDDQQAQIYVGVKVGAELEARQQLLAELREQHYSVEDLTDNEIAKYHVRHMVGGHGPGSLTDERVYRFEFPERPGALLGFLKKLGKRFNISLFHYRNHGAAFGRVLVGLQVPEDQINQLEGYVSELGYRFYDETDNIAYQRFLR